MQKLIDERVPSHFLQPEMCSHLALAQTKFGTLPLTESVFTYQRKRLLILNRLAAFVNSVFIVDQRPISEATCEEIDKVVIPGWYLESIREDANDRDSMSIAPDPTYPISQKSSIENFWTEDSFVSGQSPEPWTHYAPESPSARSSTSSQQSDEDLPALPTDDNPSFSSMDATQPQGNVDVTARSMYESRFRRREEDYDQPPEKSDDIELVRMLGLLLRHRQSRAAPRFVADVATLSLPELLFTALGVSSSSAGQTFAITDINNDLIELILGRGVDPNVTTSYFRARGRSAWHPFVQKWVRTAWSCEFEPDATRSLSSQRSKVDIIDLKAWSIAELLLLHGADIDSSCCLAGTLRCGRFYQEHDCRCFPVAQILNACVPRSEHIDLQLVLARARSSSAETTVEPV